ncbi:MAG: hypothetical protein LQ346_005313 [Caloplaca aetnensis]|nr:MAG: hypothetical protein LQ346_005313 [Caloplaca aetnensis]
MYAINTNHNLPTPPSMDFASPSAAKQVNGALDSPHHRHVWIITGPAGCGKSTIAQYLAKELSLPYIEGDDPHVMANVM